MNNSRPNLLSAFRARARRATAPAFRSLLPERLERRQFLSASNLDTTFGTGGGGAYHTYNGPIANADFGYVDTTILPDGKVLAVGTAQSFGQGGRADWIIDRYTAAGKLDTSFGGGDGSVTTNFGGYDIAEQLLQAPNGKFYVVGSTLLDNVFRIAVARYNADGSLDTSFSGDGKVTTTFSLAGSSGRAAALTPEGKLLVGGGNNNQAAGYTEMALVRYNTNGTLDTSFSGDGKATVHYGNEYDGAPDSESIRSMAVLPDGRIIVAGTMVVDEHGENTSFTVARVTKNGVLDPTFGGGDGWLRHELGGEVEYVRGMALQRDGKIVLAGLYSYISPETQRDFVVTRYTANGSIDTTFDGDGVVHTQFHTGSPNVQEAHDVIVQPNGKILAVGVAGIGEDEGAPAGLAIARYNSNGSLDTSYSGDGRLVTGIIASGDAAAFGYDGKLVVAGFFHRNESAIARFKSDFTANASIAGTVYEDKNHNGHRDSGEPGLVNRRVYIDSNFDGVYTPGEKIVVTDSSGAFKLTGLAPGTYRIRHALPAGWARTEPAGAAPLGFYDVTVTVGQAAIGKFFGDKRI
jgi:uncharacterized delta-60 repeat protein